MHLPLPRPAFTNTTQPRMYMRGCAGPSAFTLTELLVVIGIIVLFVTLALPAFNLISGGKSIAGAENELSALLGQARMQAVGVQDYRGLVIYRDAAADRFAAATVSAITYSAYPPLTPIPAYPKYSYVTYGGNNYVSLVDVPGSGSIAAGSPAPFPPNTTTTQWASCNSNPSAMTLDVTADSDVQSFPAGVGVQVINNCAMNGGARVSNGYLPIGVILFNGEGALSAIKTVTFAVHGHLGDIGSFTAYAGSQGSIPNYATTPPAGIPLSSSFGLVAYDKQSFDNQAFYSGLPSQLTATPTLSTYNGTNTAYTGSAQEQNADAWLDKNSTPLLINRYNGTLIRSE